MKAYESVWDAIEDTPAEAEKMKVLSSLMIAVKQRVADKRMSKRAAARLFGVTGPRMRELTRRKINLFTIEELIAMLATAGLRVDITVRKIG